MTNPPRRSPRHRRHAHWPVLIAALVLGLAGAAQVYLPQYAAAQMRDALQSQLHVRAHVTVRGFIWQFAEGRFSAIAATARYVPTADLRLESVDLLWQDGQVSVPRLLSGKFTILRLGRLSARLGVSQAEAQHALDTALRGHLPQGLQLNAPAVAILPSGIVISGQVRVAGITGSIGYRLVGHLKATAGGRDLAFQPDSFEGARLNIGPLTLLRLDRLIGKTPFDWRIASVQLQPGEIIVHLRAIALHP